MRGKPTEQKLRCRRKSRIYKRSKNRAARYVTEVTERHRQGLCDLGYDIHRRHNYDRLREALEPRLEAEVLDVVVPHHTRGDERPSESNREVACRRAEDRRSSYQASEYGGEEQSTDVGSEVEVVFAHSVLYESVEHADELFNDDLEASGTL